MAVLCGISVVLFHEMIIPCLVVSFDQSVRCSAEISLVA
jgi:hypothetical protein